MNNQSVLVLDSDPRSAENLRQYLENEQITAYASSNSIESFDLVEKFKIPVILISARITGFGGTGLINLIKSNNPFITIFVITDLPDSGQELPETTQSNVYYLAQDDSYAHISEVVTKVLRQNQAVNTSLKYRECIDVFSRTFPAVESDGSIRAYYN